jgi:hypothetical protein
MLLSGETLNRIIAGGKEREFVFYLPLVQGEN